MKLTRWLFLLIIFFPTFPLSLNLYPGGKSRLTKEELLYLPVGPSWYTAMHLAYLSAVMANHDLASFSLTERPLWNAHGHSYFWQRFFLENSDITSPESPGRPIIHIPFFLPKEMSANLPFFQGGRGEGWYFSLPEISEDYFHAQYSLVATVGGFPFFGKGIFDREPPQLWGAPSEKRKFYPSQEILTELSQGKNRWVSEHIFHERNFVTTSKREFSQRHNFFWQRQENTFSFLWGFEYLSREQDGAEWGEREEFTQSFNRYGFLTLFRMREWIFDLNSSLGFSWSKKSPPSGSLVRPIEEEINHRNLEFPTESKSFFWDNYFSLNIPAGFFLLEEIQPFYHLRYEGVLEKVNENLIFAQSYGNRPLMVSKLLDGNVFQRNLVSQKIGGQVNISRDFFDFSYYWAFLADYLFHDKKDYTRIAFLLGASSQFYLANKTTSLFFAIRRDVPPLTQKEASFFVKKDLWARYLWRDLNNNGNYDEGEEGSPLPRQGGKVTDGSKASSPFYYEGVFGLEHSFPKLGKLVSKLTYRYYNSLYQIRFKKNFPAEFVPILREDIEGKRAFNRIDNLIGKEEYEIVNQKNPAQYLAWEWQFLRYLGKGKDFFSVSVGAYFNTGSPPPGQGFSNDIAHLSYQTADPNGRLNLFGRLDYDRGYMLRLIHGFSFAKNFFLTNSLLYRDGVPIGKVRLVDGLSQGPQLAQYSARGGGLSGIGRYVFYMEWDMRLLYENPSKSWYCALDIYNVNNFSLELKENAYYNQDYRKPTESMMGRTIRLNLGVRL